MNLKTLSLLTCAISSVTFSMADDGPTPDTGSSTTIRLGIFSPTDSLTSDALGSHWWRLGVDLDGRGSGQTRMFEYTDIEFASNSASDDQGDSASITLGTIAIGVGVKEFFTTGSQDVVPYVGAGVGAYFDTASASLSSNGESGTGSTSTTNFGFKLLGGVRFQRHWVLELAYNYCGDVSGINLNGTSLDVGYRF